MAFKKLYCELGSNDPRLEFATKVKTNGYQGRADNLFPTMARALLYGEQNENVLGISRVEATRYSYAQITERRCSVFFASVSEHSDISKIAEVLTNTYRMKMLVDVSKYIDKANRVVALYNEETCATVVLCPEAILLQAEHMAASCFHRLVPWLFKDKPLFADKINLMRMIYEGRYSDFEAKADEIYKYLDLDTEFLQAQLSGFCCDMTVKKIERLESEIIEAQKIIKDEYQRIFEAEKRLRERQLELAALRSFRSGPYEKDNELIEYLKHSSSLVFLGKEDRYIKIGYVGYLNDCDERAFRACIENEKFNYIYSRIPHSPDLAKRFLEAVWGEHRFNLRTYCEWRVGNDASAGVVRHSSMGERFELIQNRIRQPHIDKFACYAGYEKMLLKYAMEDDFIGVLTTIAASSASLNWNDSTVVGSLLGDLFDSDCSSIKWFEDKGGNLFTTEEVIDILKKETENEQEE